MESDVRQAGRGWVLFIIIAAYLMLSFLYRVFIPGGSWSTPPWHYVAMGATAMLIMGLLAQRSTVASSLPAGDARWKWVNPLFWGGLAAGCGSLLIRFTSTAAWWTGHLNN